MEKFKVGLWVGDEWVSQTLLASSEKEARQMAETSLRWKNPNEKVRAISATMIDSSLKRLRRYE